MPCVKYRYPNFKSELKIFTQKYSFVKSKILVEHQEANECQGSCPLGSRDRTLGSFLEQKPKIVDVQFILLFDFGSFILTGWFLEQNWVVYIEFFLLCTIYSVMKIEFDFC